MKFLFNYSLHFLLISLLVSPQLFAGSMSVEAEYQIKLKRFEKRKRDFYKHKERQKKFTDMRLENGQIEKVKRKKLKEKRAIQRRKYSEEKKRRPQVRLGEASYLEKEYKNQKIKSKNRKAFANRKKKLNKLLEESKIFSFEDDI